MYGSITGTGASAVGGFVTGSCRTKKNHLVGSDEQWPSKNALHGRMPIVMTGINESGPVTRCNGAPVDVGGSREKSVSDPIKSESCTSLVGLWCGEVTEVLTQESKDQGQQE